MAESRRHREKILESYRKKANEKKEFAEKVEKRVRKLVPTGLTSQSKLFLFFFFWNRFSCEECQQFKDHWDNV